MPEEGLARRSRSRDRGSLPSTTGRNRARRPSPISLEQYLLEMWSQTASESQRRDIRDFVHGVERPSWAGATMCTALSLLRQICWDSMVECWNDWLYDSREDEDRFDPPDRLGKLARLACGIQLLHSLAGEGVSATIDLD